MDYLNAYNDPIITKKRTGTSEDPFLPITESKHVTNGVVVLTEIPNRRQRLLVSKGNEMFFEIEDGSPTTNQFKVNYPQGEVFFHESRDGQSLSFSYLGEGALYYPAARIWTKNHGNAVVETLQGIVEDGHDKLDEMGNKLTEANQTIVETKNATIDFTTVLDQSKKVYKKMVNSFSLIASTYPNPQIGWTVAAKDTGIEYRWNGSTWEDVGVTEIFDGFNVVVGSTPPTNKNTIWLFKSGANKNARVLPSNSQPSDTSVIWWDLN